MAEQRQGNGANRETEGHLEGDGSAAGALADLDAPAAAYRECESRVRALLVPHVAGIHELNSLASAIMTSAQEYALTLARLYRDAAHPSNDGAAERA